MQRSFGLQFPPAAQADTFLPPPDIWEKSKLPLESYLYGGVMIPTKKGNQRATCLQCPEMSLKCPSVPDHVAATPRQKHEVQ